MVCCNHIEQGLQSPFIDESRIEARNVLAPPQFHNDVEIVEGPLPAQEAGIA